ncbi:GNAT family N-acetyltransferase [Caenimonas koreensis DSM 17982]|uniref:GNAT family N-acetyltransferase n=1 Tax=Caenimonas koreensis DSM 17982 TaxID=1121255 RepID=A0A844B1E0_9BURK|nr:GNAT family N-acetyltransferase [Caenimonas koreensis]MRD46963.1 GNAT family N-acetyltransferase [Caenimonas koreensis DSM 17982]
MEIRRLGPDDAPAYRALRMRALWEFPEAFTSSFEEDQKQPIEAWEVRLSSEHMIFWGALQGEQLCGMVGMERERRAKSRHKATMIGMYVAQEFFGTGMGRALVDVLLDHARAIGLEVVVLTVTEGNTVATNLYERAGFRSFGIEPRAIKVEGRLFGKNHMYIELNPSTP